MNFIEDIIQTNRGIVSKSFKLAIKNWRIFLVGIAYLILYNVMGIVTSYAGILGGIINALFQSAIISNYLYLIENIINYNRITLENFKSGFLVYIRKIYSILIIFFIVELGMNLFLNPILFSMGTIGRSLLVMIRVAAFIMLNSLPEVIYQKHYERLEIITYSFEFIKENWPQWFIPNGIIVAIVYIVHIAVNRVLFLTGLGTSFLVASIIRAAVYQLVLAYAMIYRGQLFNILSTSTRRKRMFMRNLYK